MYRRNVCEVSDIIENYKEQGSYYKLTPRYDPSLIIHVPVDCQGNVFVPLLTEDEVTALIDKIPTIECVVTTDRLLENVYKDLFTSETHEDLIRIIKTAYARNEEKLQKGQHRSEKDKFYFQKAEKTLYGELGAVLNKSINETREYIVDYLNQPVHWMLA